MEAGGRDYRMNAEIKLHPATEAAMQRQMECAKRDKEVVDALFAENKRYEAALQKIKVLAIDYYDDEVAPKVLRVAERALEHELAPTPPVTVTAGG
jgi:hypothetical protein